MTPLSTGPPLSQGLIHEFGGLYGLSGGSWGVSSFAHMKNDKAAVIAYIRQQIAEKKYWGTQPMNILCRQESKGDKKGCHDRWRDAIRTNIYPDPSRPATLSADRGTLDLVFGLCNKKSSWKDYGLCALVNNERLQCQVFNKDDPTQSTLKSFDPKLTEVQAGSGDEGWRKADGFDYLAMTSSAYTFGVKKFKVGTRRSACGSHQSAVLTACCTGFHWHAAAEPAPQGDRRQHYGHPFLRRRH
jgi:hypothetical protein